jgi:hypothetical protein
VWGASNDQFIHVPLITVDQISALDTKYNVARRARRLVFQSQTTSFWNTNEASRVIEYDTLDSNRDNIVVLQANTNDARSGILTADFTLDVLGQEVSESGPNIALPDIHRLSTLPSDVNMDGVPDNMELLGIVHPTLIVPNTNAYTLPFYVIDGDVVPTTGTVTYASSVANVITLDVPTTIQVKEYVYFTRESTTDGWTPAAATPESLTSYVQDQTAGAGLWKRHEGRSGLNFAWLHRSPSYHLIDPSPTNIIDTFVITKGQYTSLKRWLENPSAVQPTAPTPLDLRTSYGYMLDNRMISDTVILHPGKIKLLFGSKAQSSLRATFKVIRSENRTLTDNQIKTTMVTVIRNFFDITTWEFGETFYATELFAAIHAALPSDINSVVLVPTLVNNQFGDLFQVLAREDEMFYPDVSVDNIEIVTGYNATNMRLNG